MEAVPLLVPERPQGEHPRELTAGLVLTRLGTIWASVWHRLAPSQRGKDQGGSAETGALLVRHGGGEGGWSLLVQGAVGVWVRGGLAVFRLG